MRAKALGNSGRRNAGEARPHDPATLRAAEIRRQCSWRVAGKGRDARRWADRRGHLRRRLSSGHRSDNRLFGKAGGRLGFSGGHHDRGRAIS